MMAGIFFSLVPALLAGFLAAAVHRDLAVAAIVGAAVFGLGLDICFRGRR